MEIRATVNYTGAGQGSLYVCLQPVFPWRADNPTCHRLVRPGNINHVDPFHVIELPHTTLRQTDFGDYLHSHQLGSKLHELYDLDLDFARSDVLLSAVLTYSEGRNVTWFLMTNPHVPDDSNCAADASCVSTVSTHKGIVVFPRTDAILHEGTVYFVCARVSPRAGDLTDSELTSSKSSDVCGDGVVIDDTPPEGGKVEILNSNLGYLSGIRVMVTWSGFADVEEHVAELYDHLETMNYSVALGSYPGGQDIAEFVSVGQRTTWTFQHLNLTSGLYCTATVKAEDRVGHVTQAWSDLVLFDNTPPSVGYIAAGATSMERFVSGLQLPVHWGGVEDSESGITQLEVGVSTEGGSDDVPFHAVDGSAAVLNDSAELFDGHSYVALLKVTNGAGLITLKSSEPFIVDSSPPGPGVVFNSEPNTDDHRSYSSDVGVYRVYWAGFSDPHSGLDYYRVGLGSQPGHTDIHPFVYVGLRTSYTWKQDFEQGEEYYATVEACNKAGLCRVVSSSSMTFDNSPPSAGRVTIGFDRHRNRYVGHNTSLPVQWTGFSDPQTGIQDYFWCVGLSPEGCEVMPPVHNKLSQEAVTTGLTLPEATPLYVMVRARNPAGFEAVGVSASFSVDLTAPEVASKPRFVSPRDGSFVDSQWDRSVLRLEWLFRDAGSPVVSHTVNIRSKETGRPVTEPIQLASDTSWALILDADHLLLDGDSHWAAVTACNAAGLCTTEITDDILIDSTPPILGTFDFSLPWRKTSERQNGHSKTLVDLSWRHFSDAESGVAAYFVTVGRAYNGDDLSGGPVKVSHRKTTTIQRATLEVKEDLNPGDTVYATLWAENRLGLHSEMVRVAFDVLGENLSGTSGTLIAIRHSCETAYCTNECTCAPRGEVCDAPPNLCREHPDLSILTVVPQIVTSPGSENFTSSAKCLEGRWNLSGPFPLANISRFEWSFGLMNKPAGEGIFDMQTESPWRDIGRNMSAVHCMPGKRVLVSGQRYVLYVRAWLSRDEHLTFTSPPIIVDHLPPQIRRGRHVTDSDVSCNGDLDYVTFQSSVTACWAGVFRDFQSEIMRYEMWIGTSPHADDHSAITDVGLNTSVTFSTSTLEQGIHYYVTVRAVNGAGLTSTAVSDGVTVDVIPPVPGVVFAAYRHTHRPAQTSTTTLPASWYGFQDAHSGVMSYHVAVYDSNDHTTPLVPFTNVGTVTEYTLEGLDLQHNHSYEVAVKARDMAGLESDPVYSEAKLIDVTPPEGVTCTLFRLVEEKILLFQHTRSFHHESYKADISVEFPNKPRIFKVEVSASSMEREAGGYVSVQELKVPLYFTYGLSKNASAELLFMSPEMGNATVTVEVQAKAGAAVTAKFYRCGSVEPSSENSVAIRQMSHFEVSVVGFVRDEESGIKSLMFGVGTTPGGLQVQPLVPTHSGYALVNVQLQHGLPIYATVHAENHAGQWSRFISQPVTIDRTPPKVKNVHMSLRYEGESHDDVKQVWVESGWTAEDAESGVVSCTCHLQGGETTTDPVQNAGEVTSGFCEWQLRRPQHEMSVRVTVSCMNGVQIHTTAISDPAVVLLHPPDLSQTTVVSLSNNALLSPYDQSSFGVRSSNSSLEFCWLGLHDPTVAEVQYRFLHESRPLTEWSPVHTYKTSVVWGQHGNRLSTGNVTAQVRATNSRNMTSDTVSTTVRLDDHKPSLTGRSATATLRNGELLLNWTGVFSLNDDVTFAVYAGTAEGYGDLINHVVTKATAFRAPFTKTLPSMFLTVQAVYVNGHFEVYSAEMRL